MNADTATAEFHRAAGPQPNNGNGERQPRNSFDAEYRVWDGRGDGHGGCFARDETLDG